MAKKGSPGFHTPFAGLGDRARRAERPPPEPQAAPGARPVAKPPAPARPAQPAPPALSADDERTFEQAMRGVTPLSAEQRRRRASPLDSGRGPAPAPPPRRARPPDPDAEAEAELAELVTGAGSATEPATLDRRLTRRLRSGDYPIEADLDLHGKSRDEAERALDAFIATGQAAGRRCVRVVHGRGLNSGDAGPVLGKAVHHHLTAGRAARAVLAFALAPPHAGGDGATLILLRKKQ